MFFSQGRGWRLFEGGAYYKFFALGGVLIREFMVLKRYIHVTIAVKHLIWISQQNVFQHTYYGVASTKSFNFLFHVEIFYLVSNLQWKVAVTFTTEVDTSLEEIAYLKNLKCHCDEISHFFFPLFLKTE